MVSLSFGDQPICNPFRTIKRPNNQQEELAQEAKSLAVLPCDSLETSCYVEVPPQPDPTIRVMILRERASRNSPVPHDPDDALHVPKPQPVVTSSLSYTSTTSAPPSSILRNTEVDRTALVRALASHFPESKATPEIYLKFKQSIRFCDEGESVSLSNPAKRASFQDGARFPPYTSRKRLVRFADEDMRTPLCAPRRSSDTVKSLRLEPALPEVLHPIKSQDSLATRSEVPQVTLLIDSRNSSSSKIWLYLLLTIFLVLGVRLFLPLFWSVYMRFMTELSHSF